ncbi:hypothetical protein C8F04DRAFT_185309 [Mycena alexandri]|uniref:Uncharacterized protein n=1 Tax=Mycena alexandri TaxID=1745969 RepID=A0AAD6XD61_9AGAR|nr:hypothetical protein C8F04DRAFT_185309 [Mycena alexandri]
MLYETLILGRSKKTRGLYPSLVLALESKPPAFFRKNVRNLLLHSDLPDKHLDLVLSSCADIVDLVICPLFTPASVFPRLKQKQLQRLAVYVDHPQITLDVSLPHLTTLTHLDIFVNFNASKSPKGFESLPALTHLKLFKPKRSALRSALADCKKLQVLIYATFQNTSLPTLAQALESIDDSRLVLMHRNLAIPNSWEPTWGQWWIQAEDFIEKKSRGDIQPASRCWIVASDMIL